MAKWHIVVCLFIISCIHNIKEQTFQLPQAFSIYVEHSGQTKYNTEYEKIYISLDKCYIKNHNKTYRFHITKEELTQLGKQLYQQKVVTSSKKEKETVFIMGGSEKIEKHDSIWNLAFFITPVENLIDSKLTLPFRIPKKATDDMVIQLQRQQELFTENGKYIRLFKGESYISVIESNEKQLHTFITTKEDLTECLNLLRKENFSWLGDSKQYGKVKTSISWGNLKIEKNIALDSLDLLIEQKNNINSFPSLDSIPDNIQIDVLYRKEGTTYKDIYLSTNSCYFYILDDEKNRVQRNFSLTLKELSVILKKIKTSNLLNPEESFATLNISWNNSNLERNLSKVFFTELETIVFSLSKSQKANNENKDAYIKIMERQK